PALARKMSVSAYLGKRASRSFLDLRSTSETLVVRDNQDGCLPILVTSHAPLVTLPSILFHSSALSWSFAAAMFSSRCASDDVPGIGNMTGDLCSNQASASCTTLTL